MPSQLDNYVCTEFLGSGISGDAYLGTDETGMQVAIKIFKKEKLDTLRKEVEVYSNLNHPNMVRMLAFKEDAMWIKSDG